jgi:hypothetical protein
MSWTDLKFVFAAHFAAEIGELHNMGEALLRRRLAALSDEERKALQAALRETAA